MNYIRLSISLKDDYHELLIAELLDLDFEGFEQQEDRLIASIPATRFDDSKREAVELLLHRYGGSPSVEKEEVIEPRNWNQAWEESIQPQVIGKFYVHPTWTESESKPGKIDLIIDPKMAFGTGYHETTRLMLEWLPDIIEKGDRVLDAGTGTGILSIAALKLGAVSCLGFDIDEWSETNAGENIYLNEVNGFEVKLGSTEVIPDGEKYELILANINRNALIDLLPELIPHLENSGKLLLSGLLPEDESKMLGLPSVNKLNHVETRNQGEWIAILFEHEGSN